MFKISVNCLFKFYYEKNWNYLQNTHHTCELQFQFLSKSMGMMQHSLAFCQSLGSRALTSKRSLSGLLFVEGVIKLAPSGNSQDVLFVPCVILPRLRSPRYNPVFDQVPVQPLPDTFLLQVVPSQPDPVVGVPGFPCRICRSQEILCRPTIEIWF